MYDIFGKYSAICQIVPYFAKLFYISWAVILYSKFWTYNTLMCLVGTVPKQDFFWSTEMFTLLWLFYRYFLSNCLIQIIKENYLFFQVRLPPEVNRVLYVRNLPYKITAEEMYDIFGKYGAIRQIRVGNTPETRGTAFVVYEDIFDAKNACDHLSGNFSSQNTRCSSRFIGLLNFWKIGRNSSSSRVKCFDNFCWIQGNTSV